MKIALRISDGQNKFVAVFTFILQQTNNIFLRGSHDRMVVGFTTIYAISVDDL